MTTTPTQSDRLWIKGIAKLAYSSDLFHIHGTIPSLSTTPKLFYLAGGEAESDQIAK